jgi:hypothetical protein
MRLKILPRKMLGVKWPIMYWLMGRRKINTI